MSTTFASAFLCTVVVMSSGAPIVSDSQERQSPVPIHVVSPSYPAIARAKGISAA